MAMQWFYRSGTEEFGPLSVGQVRSLVRAGTILQDTPIRRAEDANWIKAVRIKGLFGDAPASDSAKTTAPEEDEGTDPLIALTSQAASSIASTASAAASSVGGAVSGWLANRKEKKAELIKEPTEVQTPQATEPVPAWLEAFTRDNQPADVVVKVAERIRGILMSDEQIAYVAVQNKPLVNWAPYCIALTNKRFIFYRPKLLGRVNFEDYVWRDLHDARLSENIVGSTLSIKTVGGRTLSLDYLPKAQARAIYRIAQEMEERSLEDRRNRSMEETRAAAGGVVVQANLGVQTPAPAPAAIENVDPMQKLQQLKNMADAGLISTSDYEAKKAEILARM